MRYKKGDLILQTEIDDEDIYALVIVDNHPTFENSELKAYPKPRRKCLYLVDVFYTTDSKYKNLKSSSWAIGFSNDLGRVWKKISLDELMVELL